MDLDGPACGSLLGLHAVAHAPDGGDLLARRPEFVAQPDDLGIDGALTALIVAAPDVVDQVGAAESAVRMAGQYQQQFVISIALRTPSAISGSVTLSASSVATAPGEMTVVRMLYGLTSCRSPSEITRTAVLVAE